MQNTDTPVSPEIVALIEKTIREAMAPYGCRSIDVRAGEDHAGNPAIFVEATYDLRDEAPDLGVTSRILTPLVDKMWDVGERRFPYVRHVFHEHQTFDARKRVRA